MGKTLKLIFRYVTKETGNKQFNTKNGLYDIKKIWNKRPNIKL